MEKLYHRIPENMVGTILYPLSALQEAAPDVHDQAIQKYEKRRDVLEYNIPPLNCKWSDVIFLSPVHPQLIRDALIKLGHMPVVQTYFEIDASLLDPQNAVIYRSSGKGKMPNSEDFTTFRPESINEELRVLPAATEQYYRENLIPGVGVPFAWQHIPHVLYKGSIDTAAKGVRIIDLI